MEICIYIYNNGQIPRSRSQEPRTKSQGQGAMIQEPYICIYRYIPRAMQSYHARAKDPRAKDQQPRTKRRGPCKSPGPGTKDQEPWTMSPAGTKSHMLRAKDLEPRTKRQGPRAKGLHARIKDQEPKTRSHGHAGTKYIMQEPNIYQGPRTTSQS